MNNDNLQFNINPQSQPPQPEDNQNIPTQPMNNHIPNPINDAINLGNQQQVIMNNLNQTPNNPINNNGSIFAPPPEMIPPTENQTPNLTNNSNTFINPVNLNTSIDFNETSNSEGITLNNNSKFINNTSNYNETTINDLNVDGEYNNMQKTDYSQDPKVMENLNKVKKTTVQVPADAKTFIIIAIVLLIFIFVMPYIFDLIRNVKY